VVNTRTIQTGWLQQAMVAVEFATIAAANNY
jgi:hypothetical protein